MAGNTVQGQWQNADGLPVKFPQVYASPAQRVNKPTQLAADQSAVKELIIPYDLSKLTAATTSFTTDLTNGGVTTGFSEHDAHIPANSTILSVEMYATATAVGGTSITLGTYKIDGTTIGANNLITATEGVIANMTIGKGIVGQGTLAIAASNVRPTVGAFNSFPAITTVGTFTAGTGFILIRYVDIAANPELYAAN